MKKFLAVFLGLIMIFAFTACGKTNNDDTGAVNPPPKEEETGDKPDTSGKILIAYFSATRNTEKVAGYIAEATGGELFELVPVIPYTSADLSWTTAGSRVNREHDDETLRNVELENTTPQNWEDYDTVFIGYPIWWGIAAWPVNNFVKENDFGGKKVIPFATSASSGMGQSGSLLQGMAKTGEWLEGRRFSSSASEASVKEWINGLNLQK